MFFKDSNKDNKQEDFIKITALLIHAAKIDESYSNQEEIIIKNALSKMGVKEQDIQKAIDHLNFELQRLNKTTNVN